MLFPTMSGAEPNLRCHKPALISATGAVPRRSSSAVNDRPRVGLTPKISKKFAETMPTRTRSASPLPVMLKSSPRYAAIEVKLELLRRQSKKLGQEIEELSKFAVFSES